MNGKNNIKSVFYVDVTLPGTYKDFYTYEWQFDLPPKIGIRVLVPFVKKEKFGIIIGISSVTNIEPNKLRPIIKIIDDLPVLQDSLIEFAFWVAKFYFIPISEIFSLLFPNLERQLKPLVLKKNELLYKIGKGTEACKNPTTEQIIVIKNIIHDLTVFKCHLLFGVTGSGKTEVYFQVMQQVFLANKQVLILLPEISLMDQWITRFSNRFQVKYAIMHSALSARERQKSWLALLTNQVNVIFGTRSSILAPFNKLGLIIVDEEHDQSLYQQEKFNYSARDVAVMRAKRENIPIILGSATPSIESYFQAIKAKYNFLQLPKRVVATNLLKISIEDTKVNKPKKGLTTNTLIKIKQHLDNNSQVLIFLNRRGYAPVLYCKICGWTADCPHCTSHLTWHKNKKKLICHHCYFSTDIQPKCSNGHEEALIPVGLGTQRLDDDLKELFPNINIIRIDRDEIKTKKKLEQHFNQIKNGTSQLIIGTQMMAKGHHFPNLTLVVIVDVDQAIYHPDFRSIEQLGQLISQVSGRAGREDKPGEVILQTAFAKNKNINILLQEGYLEFLKNIMNERKDSLLPPFSYIALIHGESKKLERAMRDLNCLKQKILKDLKITSYILGPAPALMTKKSGIYRAKLLLKFESRSKLHDTLIIANDIIHLMRATTKFLIEVNPISII